MKPSLVVAVALVMAVFGHAGAQAPEILLQAGAAGAAPPIVAADARRGERMAMVRDQIAARGVRDRVVLAALERVPRHRFVPAGQAARAYADRPLPIGHGQTISQPFIVGYMTELLGLEAGDRVLEVGTGSAYQAAVLAEIAAEVVSIEIVRPLAESAAARLEALGYGNVTVLHGDGYFGWPDRAPYDAVIVTAAAEHVPPPLVAQLRPGARMAIPVGASTWTQNLLLVEKHADGRVTTRNLLPVRFVPLTGSR
jgi:protein-L-isoaspartate(D-aspartate) O-methyltransferase